MNIPITTAFLALLTVAMLLLRIFWNSLPSPLRSALVASAIALVLLQAFSAATKWGTTSNKLNLIFNWLAVAAYELLILLFSRLSPRWLTSLSAAILLVPIFASSVVLPLAELFDASSPKTVSLGGHLFSMIKPWSNPGGGHKGVDLIVSYRPPFAPFLRHKVVTIPFNDHECNSSAAIAIPSPSTRTVLARCPSESGTVDKVFPLP